METVQQRETKAILEMAERIKELEMLLARANKTILDLIDEAKHK